MRFFDFSEMIQVLRDTDEMGNNSHSDEEVAGAIDYLADLDIVPESLSKKNLMGIIRRIKR